ncbi:hypothetical protein DFH07DRAFT_93558 [Mycena maculata]|uniref:Uncharacterized protein n=1 Tax=Mycena maculata TaxID=230809 RepID=A0AAD7MYB5_9AGAR|nr:hypothetical protein DFH07DRAFT_93558 [Mycena maculata]
MLDDGAQYMHQDGASVPYATTVLSTPSGEDWRQTKKDSSEDDQIGFKKPKLPPPATHLEDFFSSYSKYEYDPSGPASQQFQELRKVYKWTKSDMQAETAYTQYSRALSQTFSQKYGDDVNSLRNWRRLCRTVAIVPVPKSLKGCQRAIEDSHVNLMDLLDIHTTGEPVRRFKTEKELSAYTKKTNKTFPRADIPKGSLLYFLLRRIRCPPAENLVRRDGRWVERDS